MLCSFVAGVVSSACTTKQVAGVGYTAQDVWYKKAVNVSAPDACCALCDADGAKCVAWTHHTDGAVCTLTSTIKVTAAVGAGTTSGSKVPVPALTPPTPAPPTPPPAPTPDPFPPLGPARPGSPNIVLFLTDDMDYTLGGWAPMAQTTALLSERGATATHWTVHTPVCCPSRTELITGRYFHNLKGPDASAKACMHATPYAELAERGLLFSPHLRAAGYRVGLFGKYLNGGNPARAEQGIETWFANGGGNYHDPTFAYDAGPPGPGGPGGASVKYDNASAPGAAYSTSVIGNVSVPWVRAALAEAAATGPNGHPFFAYIAPKAPHIQDGPGWPITIPAPWHADALPSSTTAPRTASWNFSAVDHHWMIAQQPPMTAEEAMHSDALFRARHQALLAVDDLVAAVHAEVAAAGQLGNTYFLFTSDHGFRLGQFRMPEGKWNVYDNDIRIPMVLAGPGIAPNSTFDHVASNVDVMPTVLGLAGIETPPSMDGRSFAPELVSAANGPSDDAPATLLPARTAAHLALAAAKAAAGQRAPWREAQLVEYYGLGDVVRYAHLEDTYNNTFRALRLLRRDPATGHAFPAARAPPFSNLLYAEFTDIRTDWNFTATPYFYELFDLNEDPDMLVNIYDATQNATLKGELHAHLMKLFKCRGSADGEAHDNVCD